MSYVLYGFLTLFKYLQKKTDCVFKSTNCMPKTMRNGRTLQKLESSHWKSLLVIPYYSYLCHILVLHLKTIVNNKYVNIKIYCAKINYNFSRQKAKCAFHRSLILLLEINVRTVTCICRESSFSGNTSKAFLLLFLSKNGNTALSF